MRHEILFKFSEEIQSQKKKKNEHAKIKRKKN